MHLFLNGLEITVFSINHGILKKNSIFLKAKPVKASNFDKIYELLNQVTFPYILIHCSD